MIAFPLRKRALTLARIVLKVTLLCYYMSQRHLFVFEAGPGGLE
jgi:hypothetical protein